jgi:beta-lactamase regulating signal transducer with metallopeptidase domain
MNTIPDIMLRALCWTLLHSLWQGLILAVLAGTILVLTKRSSASLRYNLLCGGMILFLAASGITFYVQLQAAGGVTEGQLQPLKGQAGLVAGAAADQPGNAAAMNTAQPATHFLQNAIESLVGYFNTHAALVVLIWFIIFLARFVRLMSGLVYAQRIRYYQTKPAPSPWQQRLDELIRKLGISRPVILLESALIKVPVVVGFLKPAVLVPIGMLAQLPADQVESILLHELAHIRRRDYLFNLVQHIVDNLFFFNPALIWISSLIRTERENCCDDIAIRETRSRRRLIEALVSFHEYRRREGEFAVAFAGSKENQVVRRVKRIVYKTNHSLNAGERAVLMGVLLVLCAAFVTINHSRETVLSAVDPKPIVPPVSAADTTIKGVKKPANRQSKPAPTKAAKAAKSSDAGKNRASADTSVDTTGATYLGYRNISLDKLIEMKEHGVTADYILSFRKMGYPDITPDQAIELRDHGVTVEYIQSLVNMGYRAVDLDRATMLRDHGVTTEFIAQLIDLGFSHIALDKAQELRDHGITAEYISACKKRFGKLFELSDYIKLRDAGINPAE